MSYLMIIDDDEDFALAAAKVLRNAGHEVDIEPDPESGVIRVKERRPDLLILDVMFGENLSGGVTGSSYPTERRESARWM